MLIFIYGQNSYLAIKKLDAMRAKFLEVVDPSRINFAEFPAAGKQKYDLGEVMQAIQSPPFLAEKRMVVVKSLLAEFSTKTDARPWVEALQNIPESTIVILFEYLTVKKTEVHALFKEFADRGDVHAYPFDNLGDLELIKWATDYVKEIELHIIPSCLQQIVNMVGADLWQLAGELDKLSSYAAGRQVDEKMIDLLVRTNSQERIFELMDAVATRNKNLALKLLDNERNFGNPEGHLFALLARQIRLLLSVRDILDRNPRATNKDVAGELDVHPYVAQKTVAQARNFDQKSLVKLQNLMFELDRGIKRSLVNDSVAVDRVVVEMIG